MTCCIYSSVVVQVRNARYPWGPCMNGLRTYRREAFAYLEAVAYFKAIDCDDGVLESATDRPFMSVLRSEDPGTSALSLIGSSQGKRQCAREGMCVFAVILGPTWHSGGGRTPPFRIVFRHFYFFGNFHLDSNVFRVLHTWLLHATHLLFVAGE